MVINERFPIAGLIARTSVPAATVHHYVRLGLLPAPRRTSPNRFLYDERHVQALRLIRALRERRGLPLRVIRRILPDLLGLGEQDAFRPEMWDRAVGRRSGTGVRRPPGARLLEAAVDAFARRGYGDVVVEDICRAARIAKGSFYRHYRSKEEVFFAAAEVASAEVVRDLEASIRPLPGSVDHAVVLLARAMRPRLTIFLDLLSRAAQRRPGYPSAAQRILGELAYGVGEMLPEPDQGVDGGPVIRASVDATEVVRRALADAVWSALEGGAPARALPPRIRRPVVAPGA